MSETPRPFAVFDIDGTLIRWQLYHAVADALVRMGYFDPAVFNAVKKARMGWKKRSHAESFREYEKVLIKAYDELLDSITTGQFDEAAQAVFNEYKDQSYTYTRGLIRELKKHGYLLFAISGSQSELVAMIAKHYGFDDFAGSVYPRKGNKFSGKKIIVKGHTKIDELNKMIIKHKATWKNSYAIGDSEGDIPILEKASVPIAFNPNNELYEHAKRNHWSIVVERKNVVYELNKDNGKYILA